ncbi:hypothetical protein ACDP63_11305 [Paracoccus sp. P2]|uniref:hypothetical protein n=1 Tax=Paracoccus sp. P2 TaxID=3248840 RepID=UPI00391F99EA
MVKKFVDGFGTGALLALAILLAIGDIYWIYTSLRIGSFFMFLIGVLGPTILISAPVGAFALIFGWPAWIYSIFG